MLFSFRDEPKSKPPVVRNDPFRDRTIASVRYVPSSLYDQILKERSLSIPSCHWRTPDWYTAYAPCCDPSVEQLAINALDAPGFTCEETVPAKEPPPFRASNIPDAVKA
ncbi:hypothetical protein D3C75_937290 [compost metagenome]